MSQIVSVLREKALLIAAYIISFIDEENKSRFILSLKNGNITIPSNGRVVNNLRMYYIRTQLCEKSNSDENKLRPPKLNNV